MELLTSKALKLYAEMPNSSIPRMREIKAILSFIAIESNKHAEIIDHLVKSFNLGEEVINCEQVIGEPWRVLQTLLNQIKNGVLINLNEFLKKQMWIENTVGEETYHKILMPLLSSVTTMSCLDEYTIDIIRTIFDKLAFDERWHEKIIKELINI